MFYFTFQKSGKIDINTKEKLQEVCRMKKILSIGLVFCLIFSIILSSSVKVQALNDLEISTGGTASKITYSQNGNSEEIRISTSFTQVVKQFVLPPEGSITHYRICFEIVGASVPKTIKFDVNKGSVAQIRLAYLADPVRTSVVVEVTKKPDFTLVASKDGKCLVLTLNGLAISPSATPSSTPTPSTTPKPSTTPPVIPKPSTTPIPATSTPKPGTGTSINPANSAVINKNGPLSWSMSGDTCIINLNGISLSQTTVGNIPRFELREKEKILQIILPGKDTRFKDGYLSGNSVIYGMLVNYNEKQNSTVIRISYPNNITFTHTTSNGNSVIKVKAGNTTIPVVTSTPKPSPSTTPKPSPTATPKPIPVTSSTPAPSSPTSGTNVSFVFNPTTVTVSAQSITNANVYRLGNPSRIVMEITGTTVAVDKLMQSGSLYSRAVITQASTNSVKVQLFTQGVPDWNVSKSSGKLTLTLSNNTLTNIQAGNRDGNVALRLVSPGIVSRYRQYADSIVPDDSVENSSFTFMIPTTIVKLGNGTAKIEDSLVKSIVSFTTSQSSFLMLNKVDPNKQFKIIEGSNPNELLIVVSTSGTGTGTGNPKTQLVVLDPGHGGNDPGGTVGTYYEKNYNLDIALKCEAILKSRGINVAMTRTTDVFVGLDERANFANDRDAALFISIHNNIMPTGYKGSMALYYPSSYDGKAYAQIIQNNLVKDLQTGNIGLKANGGLVVIKKTKMPAVLAEIACMSYVDDMKLLNTESFRQKAAESLANSIIQILNVK